MALDELLISIKEGNYVDAQKLFCEEVNERVSIKIENMRENIINRDNYDIETELLSFNENEFDDFVNSLDESELEALYGQVNESLGAKIKSGLKKTGKLAKRSLYGAAKDTARNLGRGSAVAAGAAGGFAAGGPIGAVAGGVAGNMAYQAAKDKLKKKLAARNKGK